MFLTAFVVFVWRLRIFFIEKTDEYSEIFCFLFDLSSRLSIFALTVKLYIVTHFTSLRYEREG